MQTSQILARRDVAMSSTRPRRSAPAAASVPDNVRRGLASFVNGNEDVVRAMGVEEDGDGGDLVDALLDVMRVNALSHEMLLARFFDASALSSYCEGVLGKSGKGSAATLAERIAREWSKPGFGT